MNSNARKGNNSSISPASVQRADPDTLNRLNKIEMDILKMQSNLNSINYSATPKYRSSKGIQ